MSNDMKTKAAALRKRVEDNGWTVRDNGQHPVAIGGKKIVPMATTPSDYRGLKNMEGQLRRAGYLEPKDPSQTREARGEARRAKGKRTAPSATLRNELKKILVEYGEDPKYSDPSHKGQRGGARAKLVEPIKAEYEALGIETPATDAGYYYRIKSWLAGDKMYKDHVTVLASLVAKLRKTDTKVEHGVGFQAIVPGKGIVTHWRCKRCAAEFETRGGLDVHMLEAHEEPIPVQPVQPVYTPPTTTSGTTVPIVLTSPLPDEVHDLPVGNGGLLLEEMLHIRVLVALLEGNTPAPIALDLAQEVHDTCG